MRDSLDRAFESARDPQRKAVIDIDRVLFFGGLEIPEAKDRAGADV